MAVDELESVAITEAVIRAGQSRLDRAGHVVSRDSRNSIQRVIAKGVEAICRQLRSAG